MSEQETPKATNTRTKWVVRTVYQRKGERSSDFEWPPKVVDRSYVTQEAAAHEAVHYLMELDAEGITHTMENRSARKTLAISVIKQEITDTVEERPWPDPSLYVSSKGSDGSHHWAAQAEADMTTDGKVF